jgi:hypothetical protein
MKRITIEIQDGLIVPINIPKGVELVVNDFDTDGVDPNDERLLDDGYNNKYYSTTYTEEDNT